MNSRPRQLISSNVQQLHKLPPLPSPLCRPLTSSTFNPITAPTSDRPSASEYYTARPNLISHHQYRRRRRHHYRPRGAISCCPFVPSTRPPSSLVNTTSIAFSKMRIPSSISPSVITSGGTNLKVFVPHVITNNPLSLAAVTTGVGSRASCNPSIRPLPLTSLMSFGYLCCKCEKW